MPSSDALHIRYFDPQVSLKKPFNMVILGHKHTGKSTLMRDMLYRLNQLQYPRVVVFSGTEEGNEFFSSCVPQAYIHHGMDLEKLKSIIDTQRTLVASYREAETALGHPPSDMNPNLVIVLDDLMYKKNMTRTELFGELFMNGRHWKVSIILSCQYIMLLDTACRANVDFLLNLRERIPRNRQKIYDNFFGMFPRKHDFFCVLDACTDNYECLVLDNTQPNVAIEKSIYWYKAEINLPRFIFGSPRFQEWGQRRKGQVNENTILVK